MFWFAALGLLNILKYIRSREDGSRSGNCRIISLMLAVPWLKALRPGGWSSPARTSGIARSLVSYLKPKRPTTSLWLKFVLATGIAFQEFRNEVAK